VGVATNRGLWCYGAGAAKISDSVRPKCPHLGASALAPPHECDNYPDSTTRDLIIAAGLRQSSISLRGMGRPSQMHAVSCMHLLRSSCVRFNRF
jgi:hypothetical protein